MSEDHVWHHLFKWRLRVSRAFRMKTACYTCFMNENCVLYVLHEWKLRATRACSLLLPDSIFVVTYMYMYLLSTCCVCLTLFCCKLSLILLTTSRRLVNYILEDHASNILSIDVIWIFVKKMSGVLLCKLFVALSYVSSCFVLQSECHALHHSSNCSHCESKSIVLCQVWFFIHVFFNIRKLISDALRKIKCASL